MRSSSISPTPQVSLNQHQQQQQQIMQISQTQSILMRQNQPSQPGKAPTTPERLTEQWYSPSHISAIHGSYSSLPYTEKTPYPKLAQYQQQQQQQQYQALQIIPVQFALRQNNFARQDKQMIIQNQNNESSNQCNFCHIFSRSLETPHHNPPPAPSSFGNSRANSPQQSLNQQQLYYWIKEPKSMKVPQQTFQQYPRPSSLTQYSSTQNQDNNYSDFERSLIINSNYTNRSSSLTHQQSGIQQLKNQAVPLNNSNSYIQHSPAPSIQSTSHLFPQNTQQQLMQQQVQQQHQGSNQCRILKTTQGEFNQMQNKISNSIKLNVPQPSVNLDNSTKIQIQDYSTSQLSPSPSPRSLPRTPTSMTTAATTSSGFIYSHHQIPQETAFTLTKSPQKISEYPQKEESSNYCTPEEFQNNSFPLRTIPFPSPNSISSQIQSKRKINEHNPLFSHQNVTQTNFCQETQQKQSQIDNSFSSGNSPPKLSITIPSICKYQLSSSPEQQSNIDGSPKRHYLHPPQNSQAVSKPFQSPTKKIIEQFKKPFQQQQSFEIPSSSSRSSQSTIKELQPYQSLSESKNVTLASKQQPQQNNVLPIKSIKWNTSFRQSIISSQSSRQQSSYPASQESFYIASLTKIESEEPKQQEQAPQISQKQHENHRKNNYSFGKQSYAYQKPQLVTAHFIESSESSPKTATTGTSSPQDLSRNLYPNERSQMPTRKSVPFVLDSENSNKGNPKINLFSRSNNSPLGKYSNPFHVMFSGVEGEEKQSNEQSDSGKYPVKQLYNDTQTQISRKLFPLDQQKTNIKSANISSSLPKTTIQQVLDQADNIKDNISQQGNQDPFDDDDDFDEEDDEDLENYSDNFPRHQFEYSFKQSINGESSIPTMSILDEASKRTKKEYNFSINIPVTLDSIREEDSSRIGTLSHISDPFKSASTSQYQQQQLQFKGQIAYPLNPESQSIINTSKSYSDQVQNQSGRISKVSQNAFQLSPFSRLNNDDITSNRVSNQHLTPSQYRISSQQQKQISNLNSNNNNNINNSNYYPNELELR